jgi:SHS2 domain-containing protein
VICDPALVHPTEEIGVICEAGDDELLLVDWLNALIYEMDTRKMLFCRFQVEIEGGRLIGKAWGEPVAVAQHQPAVEVKGATYTELSVRPLAAGGWRAQCVVDV